MQVRYSISECWETSATIEVMHAINWVIKYYELKDTPGTLTVKLIKGLDEELEGTAARIKNKRYEVRINWSKLPNLKDILKAVFHEMTHIKQFVKNDLKIYNDGLIGEWEGHLYSTKSDWFWNSPWEMEARAMEEPLYYKYLEDTE